MPTYPMEAGRRAARNVRQRRRLLDLSQADLARLMSAEGHAWWRATVSEVERCGRNLTVDELAALAKVLGVSAWRLMSGVDMSVDMGALR